jgi:Spy/CpxP family protein refolding chaperone
MENLAMNEIHPPQTHTSLQLIQGKFDTNDALDIISQMIEVKIKYHENKITAESQMEDIKYRENKIKQLQKQLFDTRNFLLHQQGTVAIDATISLNPGL